MSYSFNSGDVERPGISPEFLRRHGIKHVDDHEAEQLTGYKRAAGIFIPYIGLKTGQPVLGDNRKPFFRLRLDEQTSDGAKYLSPKGAGSRLYIPNTPPINKPYLTACEGEFKALPLCEAGVCAVAFGGINSAMPNGKLLPQFESLLRERSCIKRVFFLGDADTAFLYPFSHEAVKLAKALGKIGKKLLLPRAPLLVVKDDGSFIIENGIDDLKEQLDSSFLSMWQSIVKHAILVDPKITASALAVQIAKRVLPDIAFAPEHKREAWESSLLELAAHFSDDEVALNKLAQVVETHLGIKSTSFLKTAKRFAAKHAAAAAAKHNKDRDSDGDGDGIIKRCGAPFRETKGDDIAVNQLYFIERFVAEHKVLFDQEEARFYLYNATNGAWERVPTDNVKLLLKEDWKRWAKEFSEPRLFNKATDALLNSVVNGIRAHVGVKSAFKRLQASEPTDGLVHTQNGMLTIKADGGFELAEFSPDYHSRNVLDFIYDQSARCPKFLAVLKHALPKRADMILFIKWFGGCLISGNPAQKFMLLLGDAGTSKSLLLTIIERIVGGRNTTTIRTHLLHERFELARFSGKVLLSAKDVKGDFLQHESAQVIKSLCGGDEQVGEFKGSMEQIPISGDYHIGISSNEKLLIRLRGKTDANAYARRLLLLDFNHRVEKIIPEYHEQLLREEGAGIFALAVRGARAHLHDLKHRGEIRMTKSQKMRVEKIIYESQSLELFVSTKIERKETFDLATEEIVEAYGKFCAEWNMSPLSRKTTERDLPDLMLAYFNSPKSSHIMRNEKRVNGYPNVDLL